MINNRRDFLKQLGQCGIALAVAPLLSACKEKSTRVNYGSKKVTPIVVAEIVDRWDFLEERKINIPLSLDEILDTCVPVTPEFYVDENMGEFRERVQPQVFAELKRRKYLSNKVEGIASVQTYILPDSLDRTINFMNYCKEAKDFLYKQVSGLREEKLIWTPVQPGRDYGTSFKNRIFLGNQHIKVYRANVSLLETNESFVIPQALVQEGSRVDYLFDGNEIDNFDWAMFLRTGTGSLMAPFSEIIPLSIVKKMLEHEQEVGVLKSRQAGEALSEAMSYHLALQMGKQLNIPKGEENVKQNLNLLSLNQDPIYAFVPQAVQWIENNGIQQAFDLYMQSPKKFMNTIGAN